VNRLNRLFRKNAQPAPSPSARGDAPHAGDAASAVEDAHADRTEAVAAAPTAPITVQGAPAPTRPAPPLNTLTRYQQDPAFKNFTQRLHRTRGAGTRMAGLDGQREHDGPGKNP
jgi:hypothetical protein